MAWKWPSASTNGNSAEEWTGFIDQGVTLEGTLQLKGTFRIDGKVKGNIISEQTVVLGEGARVEGQIEGNRVVIAGRFDGVIFAKGRVEIQAKGVVTGEVHSPCMVVDPGGIFDGRCHMLASSDCVDGRDDSDPRNRGRSRPVCTRSHISGSASISQSSLSRTKAFIVAPTCSTGLLSTLGWLSVRAASHCVCRFSSSRVSFA